MKFCPNCGKKLDPSAKFCGGCGNALDKEAIEAKEQLEAEKQHLAEQLDGLFSGFSLLINPLGLVSSAVYSVQGKEQLKKGDLVGARRSIRSGQLANLLMLAIWWCGIILFIMIKISS